MLRVLVALWLAMVVTTIAASQAPQPTLVVRNGTLIDGTGRLPVEHATILVTRDRITGVSTEEVAVLAGARVIDATGLTVLPGFIDMHIHSRTWAWSLFLQFGITTVRDVGSDPEFVLRERERERRGELPGPRIFACGPLLDGVPPVWGTEWHGSVAISSADQARAVARRLIDQGVDCLKVYSRLPAPFMQAVVEIASSRGVPVTGHVGAVSARDAADMGVGSIEHASGIRFLAGEDEWMSLVPFFVAKGTSLIPTMLVEENIADLPGLANRQYPHLELVPSAVTTQWLDWRSDFRFRAADAAYFARWKQFVTNKAAFVRAFRRAGGKVVAGSDTPNPFVIPGISLHQELERLVAAGLTPMEAITAGTSVAAALLRKSDLGTLEVGKLADILLVAGNPAADITATRNIRMVIKGGVVVHERR